MLVYMGIVEGPCKIDQSPRHSNFKKSTVVHKEAFQVKLKELGVKSNIPGF